MQERECISLALLPVAVITLGCTPARSNNLTGITSRPPMKQSKTMLSYTKSLVLLCSLLAFQFLFVFVLRGFPMQLFDSANSTLELSVCKKS